LCEHAIPFGQSVVIWQPQVPKPDGNMTQSFPLDGLMQSAFVAHPHCPNPSSHNDPAELAMQSPEPVHPQDCVPKVSQ